MSITDIAATPQTIDQQKGKPGRFDRYVPLLVWLIAIATLIWIPMKVVSYGYLPPDDALRHAGKAVAQRDWNQILVMRDDLQIDHSPGWHWLLGQIHIATGLGTDGLVVVSVVGLFLLALAVPIAGMKRPEAWIGALLLSMLTFPAVIYRGLLGRPLAVTMATTLFILLMWRRRIAERPSISLLTISTMLLSVSAWVHGSWYLFGLVLAAFALVGRWRSALWLSGCWLTGSFLGGLLTGHPVTFLADEIRVGIACFSGIPLNRMLVTEFMPSAGNVAALFSVIALLLWRYVRGNWSGQCINNPIFMLAVLGSIFGLRVRRFESDWAAPALLLWVALELADQFERHLRFHSLQRLGVTAALSSALFFAVTSDVGGRWTDSLSIEFLSEADPDMVPWLPETGGILYSADVKVFYQTFFKNPHANWRYILGYAYIFMPEDDLHIYRNIQTDYFSSRSFEPWVKKMRPQDRLVIRSAPNNPPSISNLEWHYAARETWIGRIPRRPGPEKVQEERKAFSGDLPAASVTGTSAAPPK